MLDLRDEAKKQLLPWRMILGPDFGLQYPHRIKSFCMMLDRDKARDVRQRPLAPCDDRQTLS